MATDVAWAARTAGALLAPLGRRWLHVQAVAAQARRVADVVDGTEMIVAAAYLHDVGYAPQLVASGFHPLDGARFVRDQGRADLASLVAHHTGARNEAKLRGIDDFSTEFRFADSLTQRALTYCDLTTGPDGSPTTVDDRVAEIVDRYGAEHVVSRAIQIGYPEFKEIEAEFSQLLRLSGSTASSR
jgi:hypothetical protein